MGVEPEPSPGGTEQELFLAALDKNDPRERAAFLAAACGQDNALRRRLEHLLGEREGIGSFLEEPAISTPRSSLPASTAVMAGDTAHILTHAEKPGDRIGRYKLVQQIGEGGAGVVYLAEQEEPVRRQVALKVIRLGMDTPNVIARFEAERQALAMMDHPNIARVFDAGTTAAGRPYFVMELVHGVRITEYCDQSRLAPRDRLALFIQVCRAIQHAHQKGIIHRDIKPSNILVTQHDGPAVPKVIDFGIAKATDQRLTDKTLFTQFAAFIGTPAYMSPEQAEMSGLDIDTRSDIYALGVLLYELLTGKTPFEAEALQRAGLDGCRRMIREEEPVRPSTRLATLTRDEQTTTAGRHGMEVPRLIHLLRGDLDWIVMKCLEKDRTRRYDTATGLAMDVQNYLDDAPVLARPPSNLYRLRKVLHRHRRAVAAGVVLAATLLAGITFSTTEAIRATRAERRAVQGEASARLNEYVADVNLAQRSLAAGNYGRAVQLLDKPRPRAGEPDLRGFEWRYLWQVSRGDQHIALPKQAGAVQSLAFSPVGDLLAIGLPDKFTVWDARTRSLLTNVPKGVLSMIFSPDGKTLVAAHPASWPPGRAGAGRGMGSAPGRGPGSQPQWRGGSPRGPEASAPRGPEAGPRLGPGRGGPGWEGGPSPRPGVGLGTVQVWNTEDWTELKSLPGNGGPVALSKDGTRLATTTASREGVRLWDTSTWNELRLLPGAQGPMTFSPDGKTLATDSREGITLWPVDDTRPGVVLRNSTNLLFNSGPGPWFRPAGALVFSPDGKWIVVTRNALSEHGIFVLGIWNGASGEETAMPDDPEHIEHTGAISALAFSPDGETLATASMDYSIRLWDFAKRQRLATLQGHLSEVWALAFSPDGQWLVSGAKDGRVNCWPVRQQEKEDIFPGPWQEMLAISKDSRQLAARDRQGRLVFLDLNTRKVDQEFPPPGQSGRGRPGPVALSEDFRTLAQVRDDGGVELWNTESRASTTLEPPERPVIFLALSPDARCLLTGGGFGRGLRWWDLRSGTNRLFESEGSRALFSPNGRTFAVFQRTNHVQLWDAATCSLRTNWVSEVELRPEAAAAFSPDGRILAVVCSDDTVRLWETLTGTVLGACSGHKQGISSVAFSPDGRTLATSSDDRTLKLWHVATQQELMTIRRLGGVLRTLLFSQDGSLLVGRISTMSATTGLRFYRAPRLNETDASSAQPDQTTGLP
jgi:eukaryotic-like serine/threonine-protein kinase